MHLTSTSIPSYNWLEKFLSESAVLAFIDTSFTM